MALNFYVCRIFYFLCLKTSTDNLLLRSKIHFDWWMELCNYMIVAYKVLKARVSAPEHYCSTRLSSDKCYEKTKFTHYPYRERMSKAGILQKLLLPACTTTAVTCDLRALSRRQRRRRTYWRASCTVAKREWLLIFSGTKSSKRVY